MGRIFRGRINSGNFANHLDENSRTRKNNVKMTTLKLALLPQPPQARSVFFWRIDDNDKDIIKSKFLTFPYSLFGILYWYDDKLGLYYTSNFKVGFSQKELTGNLDEDLYGLPLGNSDSGFNICFGISNLYAKTVRELVDKTVEFYWTTGFADYQDDHAYWLDSYKTNSDGEEYKPRALNELDGHTNPFMRAWTAASKKKDWKFILERAKLKRSDFTLTPRQWVEARKSQIKKVHVIKNPK